MRAREKVSETRPPIIVVMGHVDHGKSSLLEAIREDFRITSRESGGITQHIGAYQAEYQGKALTFIDTPGHEAFSAMRSRGARVADIAILVVAADEGVKPQTEEAIEQIKKAGIPFVVALNKIDKPGANPDKTKMELAQREILVETLGGKVPSVATSAITKKGIPELLELLLLIAEMEGLKADPEKLGEGIVIESTVNSKRGTAATLLIRDGSLEVGNGVATPSTFGKIRAVEDFQGNAIRKAGPSAPVVVIGLEGFPKVGEEFHVFENLDEAKQFTFSHQEKIAEKANEKASQEDEGKPSIVLVLKADVAGSLEALENVISSIPQDKVKIDIVKRAVGDMNEDDVKFAQSAGARILGFRTKIEKGAKEFAERTGVSVALFDVIYEVVEKLRKSMEKIIVPEIVRVEKGRARILAVFGKEKNRQIIGGRVVEGEMRKGATVEVVRQETKQGEGKIVNLQRNKQDVPSATKGFEVGMLFESAVQVQPEDVLTFSVEEEVKGEL
ncbi:MAG: translation initiation factor IF-2 [Candidatus Wildermuthbacteria bacterium]|nr:translation initiation factor IF-2 [Candidatus Wildermuthbacteria bacterium]